MRNGPSALLLTGLGAALALAAPSRAQQAPVPSSEPALAAADQAETLGLTEDHSARMTVPVSIGGQGPFDFIVDTGAERTVISSELAARSIWRPGRPRRSIR